MGEKRRQALRVLFDGKLELDFMGLQITSNEGLLPFRELHQGFRLTGKGNMVLSLQSSVCPITSSQGSR